jgi:uncharacterized protein YdaU (DUF1376 family)
MPLYVDDWFSSSTIASFTLEQEGAYGRLLKWAWKLPGCSLPKDEPTLASYSRLGARWRRFGRPIITACFVDQGGRWVNLRLLKEWHKAHESHGKRKAAADERWRREREARQGRLPDGGVG